MSKSALAKELATMNREQLSTLLLELYDARKDAKEYLEFYLNPDITKHLDKAHKQIDKELTRISHNTVRARATKLKESIKHIESFSPGIDVVLDLKVYALHHTLKTCLGRYVLTPIINFMARLVSEIIIEADREEMGIRYLPEVDKVFEWLRITNYYADREMVISLKDARDTALATVQSTLH